MSKFTFENLDFNGNGSLIQSWPDHAHKIARKDANTIFTVNQIHGGRPALYRSIDNGVTFAKLSDIDNGLALNYAGNVEIAYDANNDQVLIGISATSLSGNRIKSGLMIYDLGTSSWVAQEDVFGNYGTEDPNIFTKAPVPVSLGTNVYLVSPVKILADPMNYNYTLRIMRRTGPATWVQVYDSKSDDSIAGRGTTFPVFPDISAGIIRIATSMREAADGADKLYYIYGSGGSFTLQDTLIPGIMKFGFTKMLSLTADSSGDIYVLVTQPMLAYLQGGTYKEEDNSPIMGVRNNVTGVWTFSQYIELYTMIDDAHIHCDTSDNIYVIGLGGPGTGDTDKHKIAICRYESGNLTGPMNLGDNINEYFAINWKNQDFVEIVGDDRYGNINYYRFDYTPDNSPPFVDRRTPDHLETDVPASTNIVFYLNDIQDGINAAQTVIEVGPGAVYETVWSGDSQQGANYTTTKTIVAGDNCHKFVINPNADFTYGNWIYVRVNATDKNGNVMPTVTYRFRVSAGAEGPFIDGLTPERCASKVEVWDDIGSSWTFQVIEFEIHGTEANIDSSTITLDVTERDYSGAETHYAVVTGGSVTHPSWMGTVTAIADGYRISVTKDIDLEEKTQYIVTAYGEDTNANSAIEKWMFYTHWYDGYDYDLYVNSLNGSDGNTGADWNHAFASIEYAIVKLHPGRTLTIDTGKGYDAPIGAGPASDPSKFAYWIKGFHGGVDSDNKTKITTRENRSVWLRDNYADPALYTAMIGIWWAHNIEIKPTGYARFFTDGDLAVNIRLSQGLFIDQISAASSIGPVFRISNYEPNEGSGEYYGCWCSDIIFNRGSSVTLAGIYHFEMAPFDLTIPESITAKAVSIINHTTYGGRFLFGAVNPNYCPIAIINSMIIKDENAALFVPQGASANPNYMNNNVHPDLVDMGGYTLNVDPIFFCDSAQDVRLRDTSPVKDQGLIIQGITEYSGIAPDYGAYENRRVTGKLINFVDLVQGSESADGDGAGTNAYNTMERAIYETLPGGIIFIEGYSDRYYCEPVITGSYFDTGLMIIADQSQRAINIGPFSIRSDNTIMAYMEGLEHGWMFLNEVDGVVLAPGFSILEAHDSYFWYCVSRNSDYDASPVSDTGFLVGSYQRVVKTLHFEETMRQGVVDCGVIKCLSVNKATGFWLNAQYEIGVNNKIWNNTVERINNENNIYVYGVYLHKNDFSGSKSFDIRNTSSNMVNLAAGSLNIFKAEAAFVLGTDYDASNNSVWTWDGIHHEVPLGAHGLNEVFANPNFVDEWEFLLNLGSPNVDQGMVIAVPYIGVAPDVGWDELGYAPSGPICENQNPANGETGVLVTTNIEFDISDPDSDVVRASINVWVEGVNVTALCTITPADVTKASYHVLYNPPVDLPLSQSILVEARSFNEFFEVGFCSWSFFTGTPPTPTWIDQITWFAHIF